MEVQKRCRFRLFGSLNAATEQCTGSGENSALMEPLSCRAGRYSPGGGSGENSS